MGGLQARRRLAAQQRAGREGRHDDPNQISRHAAHVRQLQAAQTSAPSHAVTDAHRRHIGVESPAENAHSS
eukprot:220503-Pyramimonas_sp.AAC.1